MRRSKGIRRLLPVVAVIAAMAGSAVASFGSTQKLRDDAPIRPVIPLADRDDASRVFLEHADRLSSRSGLDYQILNGNVEFRRAGMFMYCDSAHFYDRTGSFSAYGNVRMEQGDTLFVYADSLNYVAPDSLAILYAYDGRKVRLINRDVQLQTDIFYYDLALDLGYYDIGGELTDARNRLRSLEGEYSPSTKEATFRENVKLVSESDNDTLTIVTDYLYYNTDTHMAMMNTYSEVTNSDGTIFTTNGEYNTETTEAQLFARSTVVDRKGNTLTGDTIFYDRRTGRGEVFGNMVLTDTVNKIIMEGAYGYYDEMIDSAFVTGRARVIEYSQRDSLFLHGDTIRAFRTIDILDEMPDTVRYVVAAPRVKFYRKDIQGVCDSMTFVSADSMIHMDYRPIVWSENRQIFGDEINVHLNDSTVESASIPTGGFMAELIEDGYYNQLSGKEMVASFAGGRLRHLDVSGNVLAITFPEEADSTINKVTNIESSYLAADFKDDTIERMKLWPKTNAAVTPLYLAKKSLMFLPAFAWLEDMRPTSPDDIFEFSDQLIAMFAKAREEAPVKKPAPAKTPQVPLPARAEDQQEDADESNTADSEEPSEISGDPETSGDLPHAENHENQTPDENDNESEPQSSGRRPDDVSRQQSL